MKNLDQEQDIMETFGASPKEIDRDLQQFRKSAQILSKNHPRMIDEHPQKWVGIYHGEVRASGRTLKAVINKLNRENLPRDQVVVRFIDRNQRTFIL
jgi:pyrimidine operon attenuation protein/uracil phosphoribosyltransferase